MLDDLIRSLDSACKSGNTVNLMASFQFFTYDVIGALVFGMHFETIENRHHPIMKYICDNQRSLIIRRALGPLQWMFPALKGITNVREYMMNIIKQRRNSEPRNDTLQILFDSSNEDGERFTDEGLLTEMIVQLYTFLFFFTTTL